MANEVIEVEVRRKGRRRWRPPAGMHGRPREGKGAQALRDIDWRANVVSTTEVDDGPSIVAISRTEISSSESFTQNLNNKRTGLKWG